MRVIATKKAYRDQSAKPFTLSLKHNKQAGKLLLKGF